MRDYQTRKSAIQAGGATGELSLSTAEYRIAWCDFLSPSVFSLHMLDLGIQELAAYVAVLANALRKTRRAEDRSRYRDHLATAALVFERLQQGDLVSAKQLIAEERRSFGWDYLDGDDGAAAESAFSRFADFIERL